MKQLFVVIAGNAAIDGNDESSTEKRRFGFPLPAFPAITALAAILSEIYEDFAGVSIGSLVLVSDGIFLQARENPIDRRREESGC